MRMVMCQVCHKLRNYQKYRRHLNLHVKNGDLSKSKVKKLIFQTKYTRADVAVKLPNIQRGYVCSHCEKVVVNLRSHIIREHHCVPGQLDFISIIDSSKEIHKKMHYKSHNATNCNPLEESLNTSSSTQNIGSLIEEPPANNSISVYDPPSDEASNLTTCTDFSLSSQLSKDISESFSNVILAYKSFLATNWGGLKSVKFINMDISSVCRILNFVGEENFWDADKLNIFFTQQSKTKLSPTTIHSRLQSLRRFTNFVDQKYRHMFPNQYSLDALRAMMTGAEKSLLRSRKTRTKVVMRRNREIYDHVLSTLQSWRRIREASHQLHLINSFSKRIPKTLNRKEYDLMRNYLILEVLLPNGQRSGVISGMTVQEILNAKDQVTPEGYHRVMVADHKTGFIQSATLFLFPKVFEAMLNFVEHIIPSIPHYFENPTLFNSTNLVFQTFSGDPIDSSAVTLLVRCGLKSMGIEFTGTVTDCRRAAATLTGQLCPSLAEKMALFLGHSRRVHDRHYRIQLGHYGLVEVFEQLGSMQQQPFAKELQVSSNLQPINSSADIAFNSTINMSHCGVDFNNSNEESVHVIPTDDTHTSENNPLDFDVSSHLSSTRNVSTNEKLHEFTISDSCVASSKISSHNPNPKNSTFRRYCTVEISPISKLLLTNKIGEVSESPIPIEVNKSIYSCLFRKAHHKSIFSSRDDEHLFVKVFSDLILDVSRNITVTRVQILDRAYSSKQFASILQKFQFTKSEIDIKLVNKVRTLGYKARSTLVPDL